MEVIINPAPHICQVAEFLDKFEYEEWADEDDGGLTYLEELQQFLTTEIIPINLQRLPLLKLLDVRKVSQRAGIAPPTCSNFAAPTYIEMAYSMWGKVPTLLFCVNHELQAAYRGEDFGRRRWADAAGVVNFYANGIFGVEFCRHLHSQIERELVFVNVHDLSDDEQAVFDSVDSKPRIITELASQAGISERKIGGKDGILSKLETLGLVHRPHGERKGVVRKEF